MRQMLKTLLNHIAMWQLRIDKRNEKWTVGNEFTICINDILKVALGIKINQFLLGISLCCVFVMFRI